jgi:hypothetical protein
MSVYTYIYINSRAGQLVPEQRLAVEPELANPPSVGLVANARGHASNVPLDSGG